MRCPACNKPDSRVTDSRLASDGLSIRRRRECTRCKFRFSTFEEVEILNLTVAKRDGRREPYARAKLELGLRKALEKRPIEAEQFRKLVHGIERDIQRRRKRTIASLELGEIVASHLKDFDKVAYIRFASVYKHFEDIDSFHDELSKLIEGKKKRSRGVVGK